MLFIFFTIVTISLFKFSICCCGIKTTNLIDYYWREFDGVIPDDAVPGGVDKAGVVTYIGQAYIQERGLLPATITPGEKKALAVGAGIWYWATENVKVLCAGDLRKIVWIPVKIEEILLLTNCHIIAGGIEAGFVLQIGRVNHDRATLIGRIFSPHTVWAGLYVPHNSSQVKYSNFEILTYGCEMVHRCKNVTEILL